MSRAVFDHLLSTVKQMHQNQPQLEAFCPFPDDVIAQEVMPHAHGCEAYLAADTGLFSSGFSELRDAFIAASPHARWRETYKGSDVSQYFLDRFGCYCLIGDGGAYHSEKMAAYVVYMPSHLYYPWHHHPGEELYWVIAGEAAFYQEGEAAKVLGEGQCAEHLCNQPHAMQTDEHPVMAYVIWRNGFGVKPALTKSSKTQVQ